MLDIRLEQFEGPLDLLLNLIEEEKLDITEVSLARVANQYLELLVSFSENTRLDELADFIVVAAKLLLIKSRALISERTPEDIEEIEEFQRQLKMYQSFVRVSKTLLALSRKKRVAFPRRPTLSYDIGFVPPEGVSASTLADTFKKILSRIAPVLPKPREVFFASRVTIRQKIQEIIDVLSHRAQCRFAEIIGDAPSRADIVISFMSLLELVKQRTVRVSQSNLFGDIIIDRCAHPSLSSDQRGQTLIEVLTAFFVLTVALLGALSLATTNLRTQGISFSRLIAMNLAREGIETARNIRDTNWLAGNQWNNGLFDSGGKLCAVVQSPPLLPSSDQSFDFVACPGGSSFVTDTYRLYKSAASETKNEYMQTGTNAPPNQATATPFYRKVEIHAVCLSLDKTKEQLDTCTTDQAIGMQVTSSVSWNQSGQNNFVQMRENLYNWR